jgi:hypothetical protein
MIVEESFDMRYEIPFLLVCSVTYCIAILNAWARHDETPKSQLQNSARRLIFYYGFLALTQSTKEMIVVYVKQF